MVIDDILKQINLNLPERSEDSLFPTLSLKNIGYSNIPVPSFIGELEVDIPPPQDDEWYHKDQHDVGDIADIMECLCNWSIKLDDGIDLMASLQFSIDKDRQEDIALQLTRLREIRKSCGMYQFRLDTIIHVLEEIKTELGGK